MNRMKKIFLFAGLVIGVLAGCSKDNDSNNNNTDPNKIFMKGSVFAPSTLQVNLGATVTWLNDDNTIHTVTADDASFDSGDISSGAGFVHTFSSLGTYSYHCMHHAGMTGSIVVVPVR